MKNNAIIRNLRGIDRNTFKTLNAVFGFDFEKPFAVVKIAAPFTVRGCWKELENKKMTASNSKAVLLMVTPETVSRWNNYTVVELTSDNVIVNQRLYAKTWSTFWRKGDFNDRRKLKGVIAYVIAQNNDYVFARSSSRYGSQQPAVDLSGRFNLVDVSTHVKSINGVIDYNTHYISNITVAVSGSKITRFVYCPAYTRGNEYTETAQVIDKSGYLLPVKRMELKNKADTIRKERAAAGFKATDNTAILTALHDRITALQNNIVKMLADATTSAQVDFCRNDLLSGFRGFSGVLYDYEKIVKGDAEKTYSSIAAFNNALANINSDIDRISEKMQGANA